MAKTAIIFTPKYYEHNTGSDHPETSKRLKVIMKELEKLNLFSTVSKCKLVKPDIASMEDLKLVHTPEHIQLAKRICEHGGGLLDLGDTVVSSESFEVARYAVGGAIKAVDLVLSKKFRNAFVLVRPPGHHAGPYYAAGFCVFNNIAVAATHLVGRFNFERVLILDIDAHHGNGTQEIFYDTDKVLYISLHEDPREFPGTGFVDEIGEGEGLGYNVNIPFPFRVSDKAYQKAVDEIVVPLVRQYAPQFILASVGYDGYYGDPVAKLSLSATSYASTFEKIIDLASTLCEDRFVAMLEGGYNLRQLGKLVALTISKMASFPYSMRDESPPVSSRAEKHAEKVLEEVKKVQSAFWSLEP
ncbi:MAG: histone deacetylase [Candidatus Bathyarchaeota archaeon]|nr:histone deacetylase [Candidatus Bathyarchaeota archaeon]MDH5495003.1 histone deacetylase [Candidatus Bathyarchaeota archaeon]